MSDERLPVMGELPPGGWEQMATKEDLAAATEERAQIIERHTDCRSGSSRGGGRSRSLFLPGI